MRVLIVEDDRKLARQLKKGMDESGYAASVAFDGREGLDAAITGGFDVLILDVMLPSLDGISIVQRLRRRRNRMPVLLLTPGDTAEDIIGGLYSGAGFYMTKPFSFHV